MFKKIIQILMGQPTGYVSPADNFLAKCRRDNPKRSASQEREIKQYDEIAMLRDGHAPREVKTKLWRAF